MEEYESKYEEYKSKLLHDTWFRKKLNDKYRGSLTAEEEYLAANGVLWKIGVLGAVCGFCIAFLPIENGNWFLGIVLFLAIIGSVIWSRHICKKFKKDSGELKFYAFRYDTHFEDRINEDRRREMYQFEQDISRTVDFMQRCVNNISNDTSDVIAQFQYALQYVEKIEKQYKQISEYDYFLRSLKNDYSFNAEIQKDIDKYI